MVQQWLRRRLGERGGRILLGHLHRRALARSVAVGLLCGLVPGPLQMLSAAALALWWRANAPLAMLVTLYTNPLTIVPLYWFAWQLGGWLSGQSPAWHEPRWQMDVQAWWHWLQGLGQPLLLGLPVLALGLALLGYVSVGVLWRLAVVWLWYRRQQRRAATQNSKS